MIKVCYFTSKPATDIRVYEKECTTLAKNGYQVFLVSPNAKNEIRNGVQIIGVPYFGNGFFNRIIKLPKLLFKKAIDLNADIYHFNDPASLPYVSRLKNRGKKVVFDCFEDHPSLIMEHKEVPYLVRVLISKLYAFYEFQICKKLDGIVCCYHWTQERLVKACQNIQLVFNFPIVDDMQINRKNEILNNKSSLCYAGLISPMWNLDNIISATEKIENITLNLAGHSSDSLIQKLKSIDGWNNVNYLGKLNFNQVYDLVYSKSYIGIALLDYIPLCRGNIGNMSNNKLFEYMLADLPVICTDFILWKEVVEKNNCGICVNPRNVHEIANAIKFLIDNPDVAKQMGNNGKKIVVEKYNWRCEAKKLLKIYNHL
jgi:glycosyltransferase involved in cell wall biosynthesis